MTYTDYDVWHCERCGRDWTVRSRPHNPSCPHCGRSGWWLRFYEGEPYEYDPDQRELFT